MRKFGDAKIFHFMVSVKDRFGDYMFARFGPFVCLHSLSSRVSAISPTRDDGIHYNLTWLLPV